MNYRKFYSILFSILFTSLLIIPNEIQTQELEDSVKVVRDQWGVPHIYADDEFSLFYGAGYAAAEDRLFQMVLARRSIQGRLSEILGNSYLNWDKKMRTVGLYKHANDRYSELPESTRTIMEGYAAGVNAYMKDHPEHLEALFSRFGGAPEPWTAADGVACMHRIASRFDGGWTGEANALRKFELLEREVGRDSAIKQMELQKKNIDDESAIVSREEYERYPTLLIDSGEDKGPKKQVKSKAEVQGEWEFPKMSHNWVVGGSKSKTGLPILESDPQITVEAPATWYEFHLHGGRFNVRGISVPGSPGMLIGFSPDVAWGLTALGSDLADLFLEEINPENENQYKWIDEWLDIEERMETIKVKGGQDVNLKIKSTRHGPIVTNLIGGKKDGEVFALSYQVLKDPPTSTHALLEMMAATNWPEFVDGMSYYISPGVNLIYADKDDNIAYYTLARVPLRVHNAGIPFRGWTGEEEWKGIVPFDKMPRMLNPVAGYISTANNLPIGSWYEYYIGGGIGDNARSWRLKELMESMDQFDPLDFLNVHRDATNPIIRDFVKYALMTVDEENPRDQDILNAYDILKDWDYRLLTSDPAYPLVYRAGTVIKRSLRGTPLEGRYLGSDAGLAQLFRDLNADYDTTGVLTPDPDIRAWLLDQLKAVYVESGLQGNEGRAVRLNHQMKYQNNLEGFGSLNPDSDLTSPQLHCGVTGTVWSQLGNSYSQIVNFADIDSSLSMLPPGNSEDPRDPHFSDIMKMWAEGGMHLAPLSERKVDEIKESEYYLYPYASSVGVAVGDVIFSYYPNPFTENTSFVIDVVVPSNVELCIYNMYGEKLISLINDDIGFGSHSFRWDGRDTDGNNLPSGVYLFKARCGDKIQSGKIVKLK